MKKFWITLAIVLGGTLLMSSCSSKSQLMKLKGEWSITEANGQPVTLEGVFIGINPENRTIYGNSGCNSLFASIDVDDLPNEIEIEDLATTLSLCENSDIEMSIQNALNKVEKFKVSKDGQEVTMYDDNKMAVLVLKKRSGEVKSSSDLQNEATDDMSALSDQSIMSKEELAGTWEVLQVGEMKIKEQKLEKEPLIGIDINDLTIGGNLSCNSFSSPIKFSDENSEDYDPAWIDIEAIMATRMACGNMDIEQALAKALSDTDHFYMHEDGSVGLYANDKLVVTLIRQ